MTEFEFGFACGIVMMMISQVTLCVLRLDKPLERLGVRIGEAIANKIFGPR